MIVVNENGIDESADQLTLAGNIFRIQFTKTLQEIKNVVLCQVQAIIQLGQIQGGLDLLLLHFQLFHTRSGRIIEDTGLYCSHDVGQGFLDLLQVGP